MPSPSYPSSSSRSLRFSLRGGGTSNGISRSTSTSTSTSSITITIVAIVVTASLLLVLSTINMNDSYSETNSHYYDILMYGGRAATGNGLRLSLSSKSSSSSSSIISPPSTCWIKVVGQCHHFPSLSNSDWFDDYMKGGPVASTGELCKIRQQNWESSCSLSEEEKLEEEKQKKKQKQKKKGSNNDVGTNSNVVENSDLDDVPVKILMKFGASPRES
mmetsp:Transcript_311/g.752  ORF Transcript_311/g.752 Transcript_311/m.752 type:complete len:217 (-) Transcript_311:1325-1975(-)